MVSESIWIKKPVTIPVNIKKKVLALVFVNLIVKEPAMSIKPIKYRGKQIVL